MRSVDEAKMSGGWGCRKLVVRPLDYLQAEYQSMRPAPPDCDCAPPPGVRDCAPPAQRRWWEIAAHKARSPKHAGLVLGLPGHARSTEPPRSPPADRDIALDRSVTPSWTPQLLPISMVVTCHTWQMMDRQHAKAMNGPL